MYKHYTDDAVANMGSCYYKYMSIAITTNNSNTIKLSCLPVAVVVVYVNTITSNNNNSNNDISNNNNNNTT